MTKLYLVRHISSGQWLCGNYQLRIKPNYQQLTENKPDISAYWLPHGWDARGDEQPAETKIFSIQDKQQDYILIKCKPEEFEIVEFELNIIG